MKIDHLIVGDYQTNCYILRSSHAATECVVVDPGLDADPPARFLQENNITPVATLLTHGHADHFFALNGLKSLFTDMKVYIHPSDAEMLVDPVKNVSAMLGLALKTDPADFMLEDEKVLEIAGVSLKVLHTPGHTPGGVSFYCAENGVLFSGDTLFAQSVGRTDFPGGSMDILVESIKEKLLTLPAETIVYPGHGPKTTIGEEKAYNQFLS